MRKTILLFGMLISASAFANANAYNCDGINKYYEYSVEEIDVIEIEEEVEINFNTRMYLPENFNALKGLHDIDWSVIEIIELEEDIELGFNPKEYLPKDFDPYKGLV